MRSITAFVVGNSHTTCVSAAAAEKPPQDFQIKIERFPKNEKVGIPADAIYAMIRAISDQVIVFSMIEGEDHSKLAIVRDEPPFDFHLIKSQLPVNPDYELITFNAMRDLLRSQLNRTVLRRLAFIRTLYEGPMFHIASPPPKDDEKFLLNSMKSILAFLKVDDCELNDSTIRLKMWLLQNRILSKFCRSKGIGFIPAPPDAIKANGFLAPPYFANDAFHANVRYGHLVLNQISTAIREESEK